MRRLFFLLIVLYSNIIIAQVQIEGFVFEIGNRGFLNQAKVIIKDISSGQVYCDVTTDKFGQFKCNLPSASNVELTIIKDTYKAYTKTLISNELKVSEINYIKAELERAPGYLFEITLADKRDSVNQIVDAVLGAQIEVYNNTTEKEILNIQNNNTQEFKVHLEKGNHYTILVRKAGYLAKQMEVYVNIKGCILCFDGISDVRPGVTDNLTAKNEYGVLLANVEMEKVFSGKSFEIKNILYDLNSAELKPSSKKELDKVINLLKFNPNLSIELGSHTDSRGNSDFNLQLSDKRAKAAVDFITNDPLVSKSKINARGYGENVILNKCIDGVVCTEAEHAVNRRTQIKVTGLTDDWLFKPLINIKNEEKFQREYLKSTQLGGVELATSKSDSTSIHKTDKTISNARDKNELKTNVTQEKSDSKSRLSQPSSKDTLRYQTTPRDTLTAKKTVKSTPQSSQNRVVKPSKKSTGGKTNG